ncbi:MAG: SPASM domain-containing protein [Candidatus Methanodesulfokora sp.]
MFEKAISGIMNLAKYKVKTKIGTTITKPLLNRIEEFVRICNDLPVKEIQFFTLLREGRAAANYEELKVSSEELYNFNREIFRLVQLYSITLSIERTLYQNLMFRGPIQRCGAGVDRLSIDAEGNVYPCQTLHIRDFLVGNVRKRRLIEIWNENNVVLRQFRELSVLDMEHCKSCVWKFVCADGCRAESYLAYGRIDVRDPYCDAYRRAYLDAVNLYS